MWLNYCKVSNIRCTKSQNLSVSRPVLRLSLSNLLQPCIKSRMKMWLEQRRQAILQLHLSDRQFNCQLRCLLYYRLDGNCNGECRWAVIVGTSVKSRCLATCLVSAAWLGIGCPLKQPADARSSIGLSRPGYGLQGGGPGGGRWGGIPYYSAVPL